MAFVLSQLGPDQIERLIEHSRDYADERARDACLGARYVRTISDLYIRPIARNWHDWGGRASIRAKQRHVDTALGLEDP